MRVFAGHAGGIRSLAVSAAADRVITDGEDGTVRVWDLLSKAELAVLRGPARVVLEEDSNLANANQGRGLGF